MRGILAHAGYVPYRRLDRSTIAAVVGSGGGQGTRAVASYDEDTTTMALEAARIALRGAPGATPAALYFATTAPTYVDKTNATTIHAALRLGSGVVAADFGGAVRSAVVALRLALIAGETALVVAADIRTGLPGSADEAGGGDGASALLVGSDSDGPVLAEWLGSGAATAEFLDRWRTPGDSRSKVWEERFGEGRYLALGEQAWAGALKAAALTAADVTHLIVTGPHPRATRAVARRLGTGTDAAVTVDDLAACVGHTGAAHPGLLLSSVLDTAAAGSIVAVVSLADGADVLLFRVRDVRPSARPIAAQVAAGGVLSYGTFLAWRGMLTVEPPRRPEPARVSASAASRNAAWKFGFVGARAADTGRVDLPPPPGAGGAEDTVLMAEVQGTVATYTVDRLAYSPSPPVVFAVVDFDGGGRMPLELTDTDAAAVAIGDRVEPTFRRLSSADGIANYFWKARPVRA
ncbi:MAG: hydroxymethylglutaryl-CoA synthase family protein [Acidimicrobiales bacterium]